MIRAALYVIVLIALAIAGAWIAERPGTVSFQWLGIHIDTSVGVLILAVIVIAVVTAMVYRFLLALRRMPRGFAGWRETRRRNEGYRALSKGMVAVAAGDADVAAREARKADALLGDPPLTLLLSAQAAQLNGDEDAARGYFQAMLESEDTAFLGLRGLLMQARRTGETDEALRLARQAYRQRPKTPWVLSTLLEILTQQRRWRDALPVLEEAVGKGALDRVEAGPLRVAVLLGCALEADTAELPGEALSFARRAQKLAPDDPATVLAVIRRMVATGKPRSASRIIRASWARAPHPELAEIYASLDKRAGPADRLSRLQSLAGHNPSHRESLIAVAEAALAAERWQVARDSLDRLVMAGEPLTARVCRLWAELEEKSTGDMDAVRTWLLRASRAAPDPAWTCGECGNVSADWAPACDACDAIAQISWRPPPLAAALTLTAPEAEIEALPPAAAESAEELETAEAADTPEDAGAASDAAPAETAAADIDAPPARN